ncbi:phosphoribosylamine--glycine ligase [Methylopila jiangsuensis]|uniref:Phosphoribosylamine--glycine ligase n=1 Tax=Methylopila jiangsuensis TaxID=586230 RepID=A0A9W6N440_9HYPH|nr:phosphoribosylamine--glycine ligase [Methylopila jiangsuensis]MDR6286913.1 phosphoribosylamine--glycine ligase [Methylopila jiangsuensis]GLK76737.1 phosphoribosylamine--glycine ligase [Methylopila jiangsuensis]
MIVLLLGSGGREHALAAALARSSALTKLIAAPGNPGVAEHAELRDVAVDDIDGVVALAKAETVDLVVVGPEVPLVLGVVDRLAEAGIRAFGPTAAAARLEGSKAFTKELCAAHDLPTAGFRHAKSLDEARAALGAFGAPVVVKADGLAAGKGVTVATTIEEAHAAVEAIFADAGAEAVIEEFMTGEEASLFALCDGETALLFGDAQDHKRAYDGDEGPNTGGMGAYSPAPVLTPEIAERAMAEIVRPTIAAMKAAGTPFTGFLYAGLMIEGGAPRLVEYNVRFGDPEAQVVLPRLKDDLLELLLAAVDGRLEDKAPAFSPDAALTVVMAAKGYPGAYAKGSEIRGLPQAQAREGVTVFHAGTARDGERLLANGGRVLAVTATGADVREAQARAYAAVDMIDWPEGFCRRDIGWRAVARLEE